MNSFSNQILRARGARLEHESVPASHPWTQNVIGATRPQPLNTAVCLTVLAYKGPKTDLSSCCRDPLMRSLEFPNLYRKSDLISLPKKGKCLTKPGSYHPIALTYTLVRIFEKIIQNRLCAPCESLEILPASQYPYRTDRKF